ncbi:hypothetical protein GDO78_003369 [Eleutherodactylus coqui]|uniref:Uncharacterized protein n=1 Tax=Eleutherodactylus coqui TaxID=57060 RepID=A0A8J6EU80_ELECQ|nr:hypothetical protein GDO78_003369 [Eleutherodactylus coqui]
MAHRIYKHLHTLAPPLRLKKVPFPILDAQNGEELRPHARTPCECQRYKRSIIRIRQMQLNPRRSSQPTLTSWIFLPAVTSLLFAGE